MSLTVAADIKRVFFDRAQVVSWIGRKNANFLNHAGGFVRRVARNSMKRKGKARKKNTTRLALKEAQAPPVSAPGSPPFAHSDSEVETLRNIQYGLGSDRASVIAGPLALNQKQGGFVGGAFVTSGTVPQLHEFGGKAVMREKKVGDVWRPYGRRKPRPGQPTRRRSATYPKRPFMRPALQKSLPKFPSLFFRSGG